MTRTIDDWQEIRIRLTNYWWVLTGIIALALFSTYYFGVRIMSGAPLPCYPVDVNLSSNNNSTGLPLVFLVNEPVIVSAKTYPTHDPQCSLISNSIFLHVGRGSEELVYKISETEALDVSLNLAVISSKQMIPIWISGQKMEKGVSQPISFVSRYQSIEVLSQSELQNLKNKLKEGPFDDPMRVATLIVTVIGVILHYRTYVEGKKRKPNSQHK